MCVCEREDVEREREGCMRKIYRDVCVHERESVCERVMCVYVRERGEEEEEEEEEEEIKCVREREYV